MLFFLYATILLVCFAIIPTIYISIRIYYKFEAEQLKKKWIFYLIGTIIVYIELLGVGVMILINDPELRAIWNIVDLAVVVAVVFKCRVARHL